MREPRVDKLNPTKSEDVRKSFYWHTLYAEPVTQEHLSDWSEEERRNIIFIGNLSQQEFSELIANAHKDADGEPILVGKRIDKEGSPVE